jgi:hypothetical protein
MALVLVKNRRRINTDSRSNVGWLQNLPDKQNGVTEPTFGRAGGGVLRGRQQPTNNETNEKRDGTPHEWQDKNKETDGLEIPLLGTTKDLRWGDKMIPKNS